jgi:predicted small secreted protein
MIMKNTRLVLILLLLFSSIVITSCSSGRGIGGSSKKCGCGINKGMGGY